MQLTPGTLIEIPSRTVTRYYLVDSTGVESTQHPLAHEQFFNLIYIGRVQANSPITKHYAFDLLRIEFIQHFAETDLPGLLGTDE